ncbi:4'-phosphopantetheinyl transferase family protein [Thalassovita taeanensis]|uniref:Enterobactin synthase component D n=1 Tax=Thalassovita taeanensis TaxID=657014 RepID=A0A1H9C1H3_9RHOB|nr:4'-phosphopantetheinyl transferase superfamily protein [Thalassovita taeanensis]SEP95090.1 4'-phosphopantetheinyl transferase EntD (siderophore biosynthesis) [Thalassovita taeanensis]
MNRVQEVCDTVGRLFGTGVGIGVEDPRSPSGPLWPDEQTAVARAVPKRAREFTAGRVAARQALRALQRPETAILRANDRAPVWPDGIIGTLSHSDTLCVAVLARTEHALSLGLDLEEDTPLPPELWPEILSPAEILDLRALPEPQRGRRAKFLFSAKECAYKAQYSLTRALFGFQTLRIWPKIEAGRFQAEFLTSVLSIPKGTLLDGRFAYEHGHVMTAVTLTQAQLQQPCSDPKGI